MHSWLEKIFQKVKNLNSMVSNYKEESIIQSLPNVAYTNQAKKHFDNNEYSKAEELLLKAIEINNKDNIAYKYLGKIYEKNLDFAKALMYYDTSSKLSPQDKEIWLRLGFTQLNLKNYEAALESFELADKVSPYNPDVITGWGMAYMQLKKYAQARDKFIQATKINKYNYTAILLSAVMEVKLQEYESAQQKLEFLTKVAPNESCMLELANLKVKQNDLKQAEKYAKKTIEINSMMLPAYLLLGEIYSIQKLQKEFEEVYNYAITKDLDCPNLHLDYGFSYIKVYEYKKAQEQFNLVLEKENNNKHAKIGLALTQAYENNFLLLDEIAEKNMENPIILEAIGWKLYYQQNYIEAIDKFKKAYSLDNNQTYNIINIARCYIQMNNSDKVIEYYEKFLMADSTYLTAYIEYAQWLISTLNYSEAKRKLVKAEKLAPDDSKLLNLLFYSSYRVVKDNICEYNVKETLKIAQKLESMDALEYKQEKQELEEILNNIQGK